MLKKFKKCIEILNFFYGSFISQTLAPIRLETIIVLAQNSASHPSFTCIQIGGVDIVTRPIGILFIHIQINVKGKKRIIFWFSLKESRIKKRLFIASKRMFIRLMSVRYLLTHNSKILLSAGLNSPSMPQIR